MTLQKRLQILCSQVMQQGTDNPTELPEALASIKKDMNEVLPSPKQPVDSETGRNINLGYNQALKDVRERLERYIGK